jgi:hypothetical protein
MTTQKEIQLRYEEIDECVKDDEAIMLAILLHMFGGSIRELWDAVHEDISCLRDAEAYSKDKLDFQEEFIDILEGSFDHIMNEITERELLGPELELVDNE